MTAEPRRWCARAALTILTATSAVWLAGCGSATRPRADPATRPTPTTTGGPLKAPATSPAQDGQYFEDLARVDPGLNSYVQGGGNTALQALLTDGAAFCAFLARGGGIDTAMSDLAAGAASVESRTHLPQSVTTFNAIDAVALLTLCPGEQSLLPSADRQRIRSLGTTLGAGGAAG